MKDVLALALSVLFHDSPRRARQYYDLFGSYAELEDHRSLLLSQIQGKFHPIVADRWKTLNLDHFQSELNRLNIDTVMAHQPDYPSLLREIDDAPPVLYVRGQRSALSQDMIAIVGTRGMSEYGKRVTGEITAALAPYFCIVSGMAKGVDTIAHTTTVAQNGTTVAIMGTGIDQIYPKENEALSRRILEKGAIVSENPPGTDGQAFRFPQRNRLISGMARGVVIVEAMTKSGALSTASHAIAQNRDLFVVPGPIFSEGSQGTNQLIQQGAFCVTSPNDILGEYDRLPIPRAATATISPPSGLSPPGPDIAQLQPAEHAVWTALAEPSRSIDAISETTGIPMHQLLPILTLFELKGWVGVGPGRRYSRHL